MLDRRATQVEPGPAVLVLDEIEEGFSDLVIEIGADELGLEDKHFSFPNPIRASLRIGRAMQSFNLNGTIGWQVAGECCRCLAPVVQAVKTPLKLLLQRREASAVELEAYADEEGVEIVDPGARNYDLSDRLREAVALELPMRVYCREDCMGLCPTCGTDRNTGTCDCASAVVDPRWEALAGLGDKK